MKNKWFDPFSLVGVFAMLVIIGIVGALAPILIAGVSNHQADSWMLCGWLAVIFGAIGVGVIGSGNRR